MSAPAVSVLLTSAQETSTTVLLAEAAARRGMEIETLTGPQVAERLAGRAVYWYGGPIAAERVAARLDLGLLEPPDDWLAGLPEEFVGRRIDLATLSEARSITRPVFVKPPSEKSFPAAVYADGTRLPTYGDSLGPDTPVLVSQVVTFAVEYRLFVLDGQIAAGGRYARYGRLDVASLDADRHEQAVRDFANRVLADCVETLPSAVTVDVGLIQDPDTGRETWAVVEANMPWFAHCYAADPDRVLDVVLRSAGPRALVAQRDVGFVRCPSVGAAARR
ncbi:MAG TPA: ATP-grasp domain-containing protein [Actinocrinis sp.]|nr:ATP-grasp domain-containing protein [Actinocrinis sp.]